MSALLTPRRPRREQQAPVPRHLGGRRAAPAAPTLDDLVAGAWERLIAGAPTACVVCGTETAPRYSAGAGVVGGRCGGCGSTLG